MKQTNIFSAQAKELPIPTLQGRGGPHGKDAPVVH